MPTAKRAAPRKCRIWGTPAKQRHGQRGRETGDVGTTLADGNGPFTAAAGTRTGRPLFGAGSITKVRPPSQARNSRIPSLMEWIADPDAWLSLLTLTLLEIVLGIDNLVFIAVLVERVPERQRTMARRLGIGAALITRLALLAAIAWIIGLAEPLFTIFGEEISWRDIILIAGGMFLLYKGTQEIHARVEGEEHGPGTSAKT